MNKSSLALRLFLLIVPLTLASLLLADVLKTPSPAIVYVDPSRWQGGNGMSWEKAYGSLQEALDRSGPRVQIWCAKGDLGEVAISKPVKIYGGFDGTEAALEERDWISNISSIHSLRADAEVTLDGLSYAISSNKGRTSFLNVDNVVLRNCRFKQCFSDFALISFKTAGALP
jgi:hypothetical protein